MPLRHRPEMRRVFETRSHAWADVGLARQLSRAAVTRARIETILLLPFAIGILLAYSHRRQLFPGLGTPVRIITVVTLLAVGWGLARSFGRLIGPALFRRMDPATAGTVGFLVRLVTIVIALLIALRIAGLRPRELAVGGGLTAGGPGRGGPETVRHP